MQLFVNLLAPPPNTPPAPTSDTGGQPPSPRPSGYGTDTDGPEGPVTTCPTPARNTASPGPNSLGRSSPGANPTTAPGPETRTQISAQAPNRTRGDDGGTGRETAESRYGILSISDRSCYAKLCTSSGDFVTLSVSCYLIGKFELHYRLMLRYRALLPYRT